MPCTLEVRDIPEIRGVRRIKLLRDMRGHDNRYDQPQGVDLPAGTILQKADDEGTSRGDVFFELVDPSGRLTKTVALPWDVLKPRCPYDLGAYDPEYVQPLTE